MADEEFEDEEKLRKQQDFVQKDYSWDRKKNRAFSNKKKRVTSQSNVTFSEETKVSLTLKTHTYLHSSTSWR